ncbi:MAG TPA: type II toxin-antitoxin system VapC family toxin [Stellaceae bacterium]|nr:type II toxin-antitoxin system VapC family toxin [Stellaceae bacterium]
MYLVDTNVLSEARRGTAEARNWLRSIDPETLYPSVITLGEIMKGIELKQRTDARAAAPLRQWLEELRQDHADRILPVTDDIALEWGRLAAERPRAMADALIAATAIVHRKTIVTRNTADFAGARIPLINPWLL